MLGVSETLICYFDHKATEDEVYKKLDEITEIALPVEQTKMGSTTSWVKREQTNLRTLFTRVTVIKRTSFIETGYAFLDVITVVTIGLLLVSRLENFTISLIMVALVTQIFVYMIRLIKDIDHPFEYPEVGKVRAADVHLFPLREYYERARRQV